MAKTACAVDEIKSLSPDEIKTILDKDKKGEFLLLDVRQSLVSIVYSSLPKQLVF